MAIQDSDIYQTHHTLLDTQRGELRRGEKGYIKGNIMCWKTNFSISWPALGWLWWLLGQGKEEEKIKWIRGEDHLNWGKATTPERGERKKEQRKWNEEKWEKSSALWPWIFVSIYGEVSFLLYLNKISSIGCHNWNSIKILCMVWNWFLKTKTVSERFFIFLTLKKLQINVLLIRGEARRGHRAKHV